MISSYTIFLIVLCIIAGIVAIAMNLWNDQIKNVWVWIGSIIIAGCISGTLGAVAGIGTSYILNLRTDASKSAVNNETSVVTETHTLYKFEDDTYLHCEKIWNGSYVYKYIIKDDRGKHTESIESTKVVYGENSDNPMVKIHSYETSNKLFNKLFNDGYVEFCVPAGYEVYQ